MKTALISIKGKSFGTFEGFGPKLVIGCFVFVENIELWSGGGDFSSGFKLA